MTIQELVVRQVKDKCKYCNKKQCEGIRVTQENKTTCEVVNERII